MVADTASVLGDALFLPIASIWLLSAFGTLTFWVCPVVLWRMSR